MLLILRVLNVDVERLVVIFLLLLQLIVTPSVLSPVAAVIGLWMAELLDLLEVFGPVSFGVAGRGD